MIEYSIGRIATGLVANSQFVSRYLNMGIVIIALLSAVVAAEIGCAIYVYIADVCLKVQKKNIQKIAEECHGELE